MVSRKKIVSTGSFFSRVFEIDRISTGFGILNELEVIRGHSEGIENHIAKFLEVS